MKTEIKQLHVSDIGLKSDLNSLDKIDSDSRLIKAWNGDYIETIIAINNISLKLITKLSGLGRTLSSTYYSLHPIYQEYERYYLGDNIIINESDRVFTEQDMIEHHQINFAKLLDYEKRRDII